LPAVTRPCERFEKDVVIGGLSATNTAAAIARAMASP
jgi:hypothetical protein